MDKIQGSSFYEGFKQSTYTGLKVFWGILLVLVLFLILNYMVTKVSGAPSPAFYMNLVQKSMEPFRGVYGGIPYASTGGEYMSNRY